MEPTDTVEVEINRGAWKEQVDTVERIVREDVGTGKAHRYSIRKDKESGEWTANVYLELT